MYHFEANEIKIVQYLDGKMGPAEEEAFMLELAANAALREQYEDELLMRGIFETREDELITDDIQQADQNKTANLRTAISSGKEKPVSLKRIFFSNFKTMAAAVLALISLTIVYTVFFDKHKHPDIATKPILKNDSPRNVQPPAFVTVATPENIYSKFHTAYSSKKDPVEVSDYYDAYKKENYLKVISAKDTDYETLGLDDRKRLLKQYMHLYKGLSYLEINKPDSAVQQFDFTLHTSSHTAAPYYVAQWYSMLAYLKKADLAKGEAILSLIIRSASPYKNKAVQISTALKEGH